MAAIHALPEELMCTIFEELELDDLLQCQKVCSSWYSLAHLQCLENVTLNNLREMKQFIDSLDHNPNPSYLKAVKEISIDLQDDDPEHYNLDTYVLEKLLFRFPNLRNVALLGELEMLDGFNEEVCQTLVECCPKLKEFEVYSNSNDDQAYFTAVYSKLRPVLTLLDMDGRMYKAGDFRQFITSFPRLQTIHGPSFGLASFQEWLPILEKLPNIKSINILREPQVRNWQETELPERDEVEQCLASKTKDIQQILVERLSKINDLNVTCARAFCVDTIKFVSKYLTGLKTFDMTSRSYDGFEWTPSHKEVFCNEILDLLCSAKDDGTLDFTGGIKFAFLELYLPTIMNKIFQPSVKTTYNIFKLKLVTEVEVMKFKAHVTPFERTLNIPVVKAFGATAILKLFTRDSIVDEFVLTMELRHGTRYKTSYSRLYLDIFKHMPLLKTMTLDIPASIEFKPNDTACHLSHLKELTLRPTFTTPMQALLDEYSIAFPNLKHLNLYYFCGVFEADYGEFLVRLPKYSLDSLALDVTFVKTKMKELRPTGISVDDFLVVQVEILSTGKRYLYKANVGLSTIVSVNDSDLDGSVCGEDYFRVNIIVASLDHLEVCMYNGFATGLFDENYLHEREYAVVDEPPKVTRKSLF